jgi:hypothetical protein
MNPEFDTAPIAQAPGSIGANPSAADVSQASPVAAKAALGSAPLGAPPAQHPADVALSARMDRDQKLAGNKMYRVGAALAGSNPADERLARDIPLMGQRDQLKRQNELLAIQLGQAKLAMTKGTLELIDHVGTLDEAHREPFVIPALQALQFAASGHGDSAGAKPGSPAHNNPLGALVDEDTIRAAMASPGALKAIVAGSQGVLTEADLPILRGLKGPERLAAAQNLVKTRTEQAAQSALVKLQKTSTGTPVPFQQAARAAGLTPLETRALASADVKPEQWVIAGVVPPQAAAAGAQTTATETAKENTAGGKLALKKTQGEIDAQPGQRAQTAAQTAHTQAQTAGTIPQVVATQPGGGAAVVTPGTGAAREVITPAGQAPQTPATAPAAVPGAPAAAPKPLAGPKMKLDPKVQQEHAYIEEYIRKAREVAAEAKQMGIIDRAAMGTRLWAEGKTKLPLANPKMRQFASQVEKLRADYEKAAGGLRAVASPDFDKRAQVIHGTPSDPGVGDKLLSLADEAEKGLNLTKQKLGSTGYNVPGGSTGNVIDLGGGFKVKTP